MVLFKFPREKFLPLLANSIKSKWNVFKKVAMWDYFVPFQVIKFDSPKKTDLFTITTDVFYGGKSKAILEYNEGFGKFFYFNFQLNFQGNCLNYLIKEKHYLHGQELIY